MKRLILILVIIVFFDVGLMASQSKAMEAFNKKDYKLSYKLFYKLFLNDLENTEINFYLGRSAFELKKYNIALTAYERITIQKNSSRVQLEIARCYFMQKNYQESKRIFLELKKDSDSEKLTLVIDKYLAKIDDKIAKNSLSGLIIMGIGYDSNLNNRATSDTYDISNLTYTNTTKDETASYHQEIAILNHKYKHNLQTTFKNDFMIFNKGTLNHSDKNVQLLSYTPTVSYAHSNGLIVDYALFANRLWYGKKLYLNTLGIHPKLKYAYSQNLVINSSLKYQKKMNQIETNKNRNSRYMQFNLGSTKVLSSIINITPTISLERERKSQGTLTNVDFNSIGFGFGLSYKLSNKFTLIPKISYKRKKYKDTDTNYLKKQTNNEYNLNLTGTYILSAGWVGQGIVNYSDIDSNIISSKYKKYTIGINFIKPF
ncbi:MAG: DUF560 domain-containing protein [Arcobacteraceae bacterium]|nr:DUF560 domain-containing protein [Arcobacteraceae bacterium]